MGSDDQTLAEVARYYSDKIQEFGATPQGVDWNGAESQELRFDQLAKIIQPSDGVTVNDLGCGYGSLFDHLIKRHPVTSYLGVDVSEDMVKAAEELHEGDDRARFVQSAVPDRVADYGMASGIFNVRLETSNDDWLQHIMETLDVLHETSGRGFAFNCLTSYSDQHLMRDYLFYANPGQLFDLCKRRFARNVALLHDYDLYEFTILVRKV
jgi:SAM-dependent methyltransferase